MTSNSSIDRDLKIIWKDRYVKTKEAFDLSKKVIDSSKLIQYKKGIAFGKIYHSLFSFWMVADSEVLTPLFEAEEVLKSLNNTLGLTRTYTILASVYDNYGDYTAAIKYSRLAIDFAEKEGLNEEEGDAYTTLGQIYSRIGDYTLAIEMLKKGLEFRVKSNAKFAISSSLNLIARTHTLNNDFESAIDYYTQSLDLRQSIGDSNGLPWTYLGFASLFLQMEQFDNALNYYKKALENKNENKRLALLCEIGIGKIHLKTNKLNKALAHLSTALESALDLKIKSLIYEIHLSLSQLYNKLGDTNKELEHFKAYYHLKEEVINTETTNKLKKQQIAFSVERSQKEAEIYQLKNVELKKAYSIVSQKNKEITASITYAKRIQDALFPTLGKFYQELPNSYIIYKPKDIVAGDFYWLEKKNDKILFAVADCTGHGVPGAMVSVVCNNALNRTVNEFNITQPALILDKVTELVKSAFEKSSEKVMDGMDICLCSFDKNTRKLEYAGAHNSLYIITNNKHNFEQYINERTLNSADNFLITIPANKQPIGDFDHLKPFVNHKIQLEKGDYLCLFSDGYADQFGGERGKKFKYKPFKNMLLSTYNEPFKKQKQTIESVFDNWIGDFEQIDDVCLMGVNIE